MVSYHSPCGELLLEESNGCICLCDWAIRSRYARKTSDAAKTTETPSPLLSSLNEQLDEYFAGIRREFDLPMELLGTPFQQLVWNELTKIPYGETVSYKEMAGKIGRPKAVRAVAQAIGANPLSILIPCHRVVGASGALTGYAGGVYAKLYLLNLEKL